MTLISEAFKKEPRSIYTFKKGDLIIRTEPMVKKTLKFNENLGVEIDVPCYVDCTFQTEPAEFICIENGVIYCKYLSRGLMGEVARLLLSDFEEGWALFIIPEGLSLKDCV